MRPTARPPQSPARLLAVLLAVLAAAPAAAQSIGGGDGRLVTLQGIRSATVAPNGLAFGSLALSNRQEGPDGAWVDDPDGSLVLGLGLGDAARGVGVQVSVNVISLTEDFGDSGSVSLKVARRLPGATPRYLGLSLDRLGGWGDAAASEETASLAFTAFPAIRVGGGDVPLMATLGAGTHVRDRGTAPGLYAGLGAGLSRNLGASLAWTGETVTLGAVVRIDGLDNVRFTASVDDLLDQEDSRRLTVTATVAVDDLFGRF